VSGYARKQAIMIVCRGLPALQSAPVGLAPAHSHTPQPATDLPEAFQFNLRLKRLPDSLHRSA